MAEHCVHREAYRFARGTDAADVTADAVLTRCGTVIAELAEETDPRVQGVDAQGAYRAVLRREAVMRVIEARSGNCRA
jgi:hypothetical protein